MKQILAQAIAKSKLHPSIQMNVNFNYSEVFYENEKLFIRRWGAKDEEPSFEIVIGEKPKVIGYRVDMWNRSSIYIPTENPLLGMGLLPFHPSLFGDDTPCIYSESKLGEINPLLSILFEINIKELPKMSVKVKAKRRLEGVVEAWDSIYQQDCLGGKQRNSSSVESTPVLEEGQIIDIRMLKEYGIYFTNVACPENKIPFSKADYTPKSDDFEFIYDDELKEFYPKSVACHILKYTQSLLSSKSKGYGLYSASGKSAAKKLHLRIGNVQF